MHPLFEGYHHLISECFTIEIQSKKNVATLCKISAWFVQLLYRQGRKSGHSVVTNEYGDCQYCYFSAVKTKNGELTFEEACAVLKDVKKLKPNRIVFTGGEPLIRPDVIPLGKYLKSLDSGILLSLNTNGTMTHEQNISSLVELFDEIRISIDGYEEMNDELRGNKSFSRIMKGFHAVLKKGGDPVAFITATSTNLADLKSFMQFLLQEGISRFHVPPVKMAGKALNKKELCCDIEKMRATVSDFWYETFGLNIETKEPPMGQNCGIGRFMTIEPEGNVYPCHLLAFPEFCAGNVKKHQP